MVIAEKSMPRRSSTGLATTRTARLTSGVIRLGTGTSGTSIWSALAAVTRDIAAERDGVAPRRSAQNTSNVSSNAARSAWRLTSEARHAARTSSSRASSSSATARR